MKVTFIGATHEVTGSCSLLEVGNSAFLVDCGMEQGENRFENIPLPVNPAELSCVLLTHAHIDHSGYLPLLYKNGFRGTVYATESTASLCQIMLRDSAHIQESEAEWKNRKARRAGRPEAEALYTMADAEGVLSRFRPCPYNKLTAVGEGVAVRFTDIGHLLGSAAIEIWMSEGGVTKKMVFSGDVGNTHQPILNDPQRVEQADYLVLESTYGNRLHGERPDYVGALTEILQQTFDRGGTVVIPSFAVGRTQEMLYFIREIKEQDRVHGHDGFPVYVDSPLANEATSIFLQCPTENLDPEARELVRSGVNPLWFEGLRTSVTKEDSQAINANAVPKVILSASGMCDAGRIRHHLKHNLWHSENTVLFVGYQAEGTLGRALVDGAPSVKIFDEAIAVNAEIRVLAGVSGHADKNGLIRWLQGVSPKPAQIFVNHGDDEACTDFTQCLREEYGYNAMAPYSGTCYDLAAGAFLAQPPECCAKSRRRPRATRAQWRPSVSCSGPSSSFPHWPRGREEDPTRNSSAWLRRYRPCTTPGAHERILWGVKRKEVSAEPQEALRTFFAGSEVSRLRPLLCAARTPFRASGRGCQAIAVGDHFAKVLRRDTGVHLHGVPVGMVHMPARRNGG